MESMNCEASSSVGKNLLRFPKFNQNPFQQCVSGFLYSITAHVTSLSMASGAASSLNLGRCLFLLFDESAHANEATFHQTLSRVGRSRHRRSGNGGRDVGAGPQGRGAASGVTPLEHAIVSLDSHLVQMDTAAVRSLVLLPVVEKFMHLQRAAAPPAARKTKKKTKGRRATNPDNANAASSSSSAAAAAASGSGSASASALASSRRRDIIGRRSRVLRAILWLCLHPSGGVAQSFGQILSSSDDPSTTTATDTSANTPANTSSDASTSTSTPASTAGAATGGVGGARSSGEDGGEGGGGGGGGDSGVGGGSKMRATDASSGDNRLRLVVVEMILAYESERREREKGTNAYCAPPHP